MHILKVPAVFLAFLACLAAQQIAFAEVIPSLAGYEQVEITKVEPDGVRILHKNGAAKIKFEQLPADLQAKYGFSADKAKAFREKTEAERADREKMDKIVEVLNKVNVAIDGTVTQVLDDGVLLEKIVCTFGEKVEVKKAEIAGTQIGSGGSLSKDKKPVVEYTIKTKWVQPKAFEEGPVFVICDTRFIVDRQHFRAIVFPAGVYKESGSSLAAWTVFPDTFAAAEGLGAIPEAALQTIQDRFRNYPKIPRRTLATNVAAASGTGTAVGDGTLVVTCAHVVNGRKAVSVLSSGKSYECEVLSEDKVSDIAVLKLKEGKLPAVTINTLGAETGETVFTLGFPNPDIQGTEAKLTDGKVSSLSGIKNDQSSMQITVPLQPGNSGGALFNMNGEIVGVVTSKLSAAAALTTGALPENVNYAVKVKAVMEAVPAEQLKLKTSQIRKPAGLSLPEVVKRLNASVVQVIAKASKS
ncbi:MAG TPA: serine protease [Verrucomicrobiales bacterium]|nr:serine protease [Verrucomicrobiales bacterium]